jgi:RHS repeat-associated protein
MRAFIGWVCLLWIAAVAGCGSESEPAPTKATHALCSEQECFPYLCDETGEACTELVTRPDGATLTYVYDPASGRLKTITTAAGTVTRNYVNGQVSKLVASADNVTIDYGYAGSLATRQEWSGAVAGTHATEYNSDFRPISETVAGIGSNRVYYGYDADGLLICAALSSCDPASTDALALAYDYNGKNGLLKTVNLRTVSTSLTYNGFGELATETATAGTSALFSETYDTSAQPRDALGRILFNVEALLATGTLPASTTTFGYTYDSGGRIKTVSQGGTQTASYDYDPNGNRRSVTTSAGTTSGTYDDQDRLLTYGPYTYAYTANGELQTKTKSPNSEQTTYHYDAFGNLKRVDLPNGDWVGYLVDGQNRRVAKSLNGAVVKKWIYRDQLHPVEEFDAAGNLLKRFVYASGKNTPDFMIQAGVPYRILSDQLGSPRVVVNAITGAVVERMRHDEFGNVVEDTNVGFTPFGFAGGLYDADTGLVRFGARDYDPVVGRWIGKDPILFRGRQVNLYAYVDDEPVNRHDFAGLAPPRGFGELAKGAVKDSIPFAETAKACVVNAPRVYRGG